MVRVYDMASCEMILDSQADESGVPAEDTFASPQAALRLQTVEEAVALEKQAKLDMPADLCTTNPTAFIKSQG